MGFASASSTGSLEIVISSERGAAPSGGAPEIRVIKPAPNGALNVSAFRVPHRFHLVAELKEQRASVECRLGTAYTVRLGDATLTIEVSNDPAVCGHIAFRFSLGDHIGDRGRVFSRILWARRQVEHHRHCFRDQGAR